MSEEEKRREVRKTGSPKVVKRPEAGSMKPEDIKEETKSEIANPKSEIKMEVHHHPEIEKKGLKEYVLEGLMIFLAVTMGFFAETIRENIAESQHAKDLAKSLYQEMYADSVNMQAKLKLHLQKENEMEYFRRYVSDSSLTKLSPRFYPAFTWGYILTTSVLFEPNDGILNQLRNSGTLRYFRGVSLQNSVSRISVVIANIRERNSQELRFVDQFCRPFMLKHYDFKWEDEYTKYGKLSITQAVMQNNFKAKVLPVIKHLNDFNREDAEGVTAYYLLITRNSRQIFYTPYVEANHRLLEALRKEYKFSDE